MCEARVTFPYSTERSFDEMCQDYTTTMRGVLQNTFGFRDVSVVKLSFLNYGDKCVYDGFPFNKQLVIHNTSLLNKFGFGRYVGAFFDVIISVASGNFVNYRIFYGVEGEQPAVDSVTPASMPVPMAVPMPMPETVNILGQDRPFVKRGRTTYVNIDGKEYTLTEARKLETKKR